MLSSIFLVKNGELLIQEILRSLGGTDKANAAGEIAVETPVSQPICAAQKPGQIIPGAAT